MCSARWVPGCPLAEKIYSVMALRFSACRELGIPVDTLKQTALASLAGINAGKFLLRWAHKDFSFAISTMNVALSP